VSISTDNYLRKILPGHFDLFQLVKKNPQRYPFLLESTAKAIQQESPISRYDILMAFPGKTLRKKADGSVYVDKAKQETSEFLSLFERHWAADKIQQDSLNDLPFVGGWFVFLSYELVTEIEPEIKIPGSQGDLPVALAVRIPAVLIQDHFLNNLTIIAEPQCSDEFTQIEKDLAEVVTSHTEIEHQSIDISEEDDVIYLDNIRHVHRYIRDGDVFQVNLSRLWQGDLCQSVPEMLYENLRKNNPAPFSGFVHFESGALLSSSPERLVSVRQNKIQTRPIAGTRPRGNNQSADCLLQKELIEHPKERAEHVMLIDLERNDLGRICKPGTVHVDEHMVLESYAHVHHIVSNITGELRKEVTPAQIIRAVFPGGTITGCPKVRCMEIIAELEKAPRGAYTGSIGYVGHDGNMDLNILIRSIVVEGQKLSFRAGAGLVADSTAEKELQETRAKAKGLLLALKGGGGHVS